MFLTRVCRISYSREKHNDCVFWSKAANKSSGQNIFSIDLPSCWIYRYGEQSVFRRTKQNWSQIIPRVSFTVHFEFSTQHTVWMQCEIRTVQWQSEFSRPSEKHACSTILKCVVARVYYFMLETLTCTLLPDHRYWQVTHVGWKTIQKALNIWREIENVSLISPLTAMLTVNGHYRERSRNEQFLDFTEAL